MRAVLVEESAASERARWCWVREAVINPVRRRGSIEAGVVASTMALDSMIPRDPCHFLRKSPPPIAKTHLRPRSRTAA